MASGPVFPDVDVDMTGSGVQPDPSTIYGHAWPCMAMYGHVWPCMARHGHNFIKKACKLKKKIHEMDNIRKSKFPLGA